jgi:hypothetical protein
MSSPTTNPIQREAMLGIRRLLSRGFDRPAAVRFTLNRLNYAECMGIAGDDFVKQISAGTCARDGDRIVIKEESNALDL